MQEAQASPPNRPGVSGTTLVHYGPIWDRSLDAYQEGKERPVAVLVCHGMGQQVRYETISAVAQCILAEAKTEGGTVAPIEVHLTEANGEFLARAEINWTDQSEHKHQVHVYEAYWAPLTEGKITYWETVKFRLSAGWNGLKYSRPFVPGRFKRWVFGGPKTMKIGRFAWFAILGVLLFLLVQLGIIGYVALELTQQYKNVLSQPIPDVARVGYLHLWFNWLSPLLPGLDILLHSGPSQRAWWVAWGWLFLWFALIAEAFVTRYFIVEYVGDVAAYVSPFRDSKFDELRHQIQAIGLNVGKVIYGFNPALSSVPEYGKLVIVGHSLGSVLAYDTLNALINLDNVNLDSAKPGTGSRNVVGRTRALITFGSPLDKTAFIFRMQARNEQDWIREQLAASVQPLVVDYELYRRPTFEWVNIWSPMDIISGALDYYDDPAVPPSSPLHVANEIDRQAWIPLIAHVQYWNNEILRKQIYRYVA
jgi:hypothetical protein